MRRGAPEATGGGREAAEGGVRGLRYATVTAAARERRATAKRASVRRMGHLRKGRTRTPREGSKVDGQVSVLGLGFAEVVSGNVAASRCCARKSAALRSA